MSRSSKAKTSATLVFAKGSLIYNYPSRFSCIAIDFTSISPNLSTIGTGPVRPSTPSTALPACYLTYITIVPSPSALTSALRASPLPLFAWSVIVMISSPTLAVLNAAKSFGSGQSNYRANARVLVSRILRLHTTPSACSCLGLVSVPYTPFFTLTDIYVNAIYIGTTPTFDTS